MMPKRPRLDDDNNDGKSPPSKKDSREAQQPPTTATSEHGLLKGICTVHMNKLDAAGQAIIRYIIETNPECVVPNPLPQNVRAMDVGASSSSENTASENASIQKAPSSAEIERLEPGVVKLSGKLVRIIEDPDEEQGELRLELVEPVEEIAERVGEAGGDGSDSQ